MKKAFLLRSCAALVVPAVAVVAPTMASAQSTGTVATEEQEVIVVTGTRVNNGVDGIVVPDTTKAKGVITQELIAKQAPGQTILNTINLIPSVNFTNSDAYGSSGGNIRIRGFDGNRISLTFDGVPLNDSGNYAIFSSQQLDPELIEQVNVGLGVTDVDSPTASAAGGTVNYRTLVPTKELGGRITGSVGDFDYRRIFAMVNTGSLTSLGTRAWIAGSMARNDKFKGPGKIEKKQVNARVYQTLGNGDFISLAAHYNESRNNFYRNPSVSDLRGIFGATVVPSTATEDDPIVIGGFSPNQQDAIFDFENLSRCNRTVAANGVVQNEAGTSTTGTGPNGTGPVAPNVNGSNANNPRNVQSCSNFFNVRFNPSNTGNLRGQSRFTLADGLLLTVDPSYQYVLANGGGSTTLSEGSARLRGSATTSAGVDLNGDRDTLDTIRVFSPNITNTKRLGLTSSLIYDFSPQHRVRVAYTFDRANHRQTGEYGFLKDDGTPQDPFAGRDGIAIRDAAGNILQQRDRESVALLNQVAGQYIGKFLDNKLRVEAGVRRPFFKRKLDQNCYTEARGSGFAYCTSEPVSTLLIIDPDGVVPATGPTPYYAPFKADYKFGKLLPNLGFTYQIDPAISVFGSFAKGFSAPRTDNLYRAPRVEVDPEETNAFDLGLRYTTGRVQAQGTLWKIDYSNRIVSSFNPDLGISIDRNVGKVKSWGADASVAFRPIRSLSLLALASYIDTELQENVEINRRAFGVALPVGEIYCGNAPTATSGPVATCAPTEGKRVAETPKWQFGGRANLELGPVELGVQGKRVGARFATDTNDVKVKGYTLVDADARISLQPLGLDKSFFQLNVINVFNKFYFGNISTQINLAGGPNFSVGSPRTFMGSLNFGF